MVCSVQRLSVFHVVTFTRIYFMMNKIFYDESNWPDGVVFYETGYSAAEMANTNIDSTSMAPCRSTDDWNSSSY